jgi:hypothetical protein
MPQNIHCFGAPFSRGKYLRAEAGAAPVKRLLVVAHHKEPLRGEHTAEVQQCVVEEVCGATKTTTTTTMDAAMDLLSLHHGLVSQWLPWLGIFEARVRHTDVSLVAEGEEDGVVEPRHVGRHGRRTEPVGAVAV